MSNSFERVARVLTLALALVALPRTVDAQRSDAPPPGWIGVSLDIPTTADSGQTVTVKIAHVRAGSPAETAGIRPGDQVLAVNELQGPEVLKSLPEVLQLRVGDPVQIRIERDGRIFDTRMAAAERPEGVAVGRTLRLAIPSDSMVETMYQAMETLRTRIMENTPITPAEVPADRRQLFAIQNDGAPIPPFEFFVFGGPDQDSLRGAFERLNRRVAQLREVEQSYVRELAASRALVDDQAARVDQTLREVRAQLQEVTRESAALRDAMARAARASAAVDYSAWGLDDDLMRTVDRGGRDEPFRPLTPYLLGSNRVAGAEVVDLQPELAAYFGVDHGILTVDIAPGTPAETAGILPGDVITRVGDVTVHSVQELRLAVSRAEGRTVLGVVRRGESLEVTLPRR